MTGIRMVGVLAALLLGGGVAFVFWYQCTQPESMAHKHSRRYVELLDRELKFLRSKVTGLSILRSQLGAAALVGLIGWLFSMLLWCLLPVVAMAPLVRLRQWRQQRIVKLEGQLSPWLSSLAHALRAVPSVGEAVVQSQRMVYAPISEELDLAIKENRLGTPVDASLRNMATRIGSRSIKTAVVTLQVATRTGGDVSATLESLAASIREMARLEAVVRTKTADGRNQAAVVGVAPIAAVGLLQLVHPDLLVPLIETTLGNILLGVAAVLWITAVAAAMKILDVDI